MRFYSFYISIHVCNVIFLNFRFNSHHVTLLTGKEHNFNKYEDDYITDLNTPYDYESVMHYRPLSRMRQSPPSPPPYHISMRSLGRGSTSVLLTSSGSTACMTVVGALNVTERQLTSSCSQTVNCLS